MVDRRRQLWKWAGGAAGAALLAVLGVWVYRTWFVPPTQAQIDAAVNGQQWARAARLIERADLSHDLGGNYYNLGVAYTHLNQGDKAIEAFMKADDKAHGGGESRFEIAALYAKQRENALAIQWLRDAFDAGFSDDDRLRSEAAFSRLRGTPEWEALLRSLSDDELTAPRGLDFLLGTWDLTRGGLGSSTTTFTKLFDGLAIAESWAQTNPGASGMYVFDTQAGHWTYTYVDGFDRVFRGTVRTGRRSATITGTLTSMDGLQTERRVEIRTSAGAVDYSVFDSRDGGRTWDAPDTRRLTVVSAGERPSF